MPLPGIFDLFRKRASPQTKPLTPNVIAQPVGKPADAFLKALVERRTVYSLTNKSSISDERIVEIVQHSVIHTPTAFNSQSNRAIVLFGQNHTKLWDIIAESLKAILPPDQFEKNVGKIRSFQAGYATILYFIDTNVVKELEQKFPTYASNFAPWAMQSVGMLQSNIWVALAKEGVGASLQHYSNLIEDQVRTVFKVPEEWNLISQQPLGVAGEDWKAPEKESKPLDETVKVLH